MNIRLLIALAGALTLLACSNEQLPPLVVSKLVVTTPMGGSGMSAGYMVLTNNSDQTVTIDGFSSPQFAKVDLHETQVENEIARMRPLNSISIEAGGSVVFEKGGKHLMLMGAKGDIEQVTLNLYEGDTLLLSLNTRPGRN